MEEEEDVDPMVPRIPHGDDRGAEEEREYVEMPLGKGATPTELEGAKQPPSESELRRSSRTRLPSRRYPIGEYVMLTDCGEPKWYEEGMEGEHK